MSFKSDMRQMIASFEGQQPAHLYQTILALERQQAEVNRKLAAARRAMKNQQRKKPTQGTP